MALIFFVAFVGLRKRTKRGKEEWSREKRLYMGNLKKEQFNVGLLGLVLDHSDPKL
jgi:hypothetical protein